MSSGDNCSADSHGMQIAGLEQTSNFQMATIKWDKFTYSIREEDQFDPKSAIVAFKHSTLEEKEVRKTKKEANHIT